MTDSAWLWIGFNLFVLAMLALDLGVFHRKSHAISCKEALAWSGVWISLALLFNAALWFYAGEQKALQFFTGYLIEKSLSVDNIFVFALLFGFFAVPAQYQHKVLFWGILSALVMRGIMIGAGAALIAQFTWVIYIFGAFLIFTGLKMLIVRADTTVDPENNIVVRWFKRVVPMTRDFRGDRFTVVENGKRYATPLLLVLVLVEIADLVFAVDSIPAIFAVTTDPFLVYTSNVFAILGLRSLYFALAGVMHRFVYLKPGLALVLTFVGVKMMLGHTAWKIDTLVALGVVASILTGAILLSWWKTASAPSGIAVPEAPAARAQRGARSTEIAPTA
ncbi:MAG TPA: TerC family protein [Chthoniobacterales bacterium]